MKRVQIIYTVLLSEKAKQFLDFNSIHSNNDIKLLVKDLKTTLFLDFYIKVGSSWNSSKVIEKYLEVSSKDLIGV